MPPAPWLRWLTAAALAFALTTLTWVAIGVLTPGDSFSLHAAQLVALIAAPALGGWLGRRIAGRPARRAVVVAAALAAAFWLLARDGWWAKGPPSAPPAASP
ncbi:MAG TPA: hypothetical protein VFS43_47710 [Polyangiaceae bacterium]|nr:hypothetical protein [Polyangiaceae bacterium]